jgi:hypothetical protein
MPWISLSHTSECDSSWSVTSSDSFVFHFSLFLVTAAWLFLSIVFYLNIKRRHYKSMCWYLYLYIHHQSVDEITITSPSIRTICFNSRTAKDEIWTVVSRLINSIPGFTTISCMLAWDSLSNSSKKTMFSNKNTINHLDGSTCVQCCAQEVNQPNKS